MSRWVEIGNALLWATAILVSASLGAPASVCVVILPALATASLIITTSQRRAAVRCRS